MPYENENKMGNPVAVAIVGIVIAVFLVMALVPQTFWVDLSMKLFE